MFNSLFLRFTLLLVEKVNFTLAFGVEATVLSSMEVGLVLGKKFLFYLGEV